MALLTWFAFENLRSFSSVDDWASLGFWIVWLDLIALILYSVFFLCRDNRNSRAPGSSSSNNPPRRPSPSTAVALGIGYQAAINIISITVNTTQLHLTQNINRTHQHGRTGGPDFGLALLLVT